MKYQEASYNLLDIFVQSRNEFRIELNVQHKCIDNIR